MADEWHELYCRDVKNSERGWTEAKLTLYNRSVAVAEQGQMSPGYMFMHVAAVRAALKLAAGMTLAHRYC